MLIYEIKDDGNKYVRRLKVHFYSKDEFDAFVKAKEDEGKEVSIIGEIKLRGFEKSTDNFNSDDTIIKIIDKHFLKLKDGDGKHCKGFFYLGDNKFVGIRRIFPIIIIFLFTLIGLGFLVYFFSGHKLDNNNSDNPSLRIEDGDSIIQETTVGITEDQILIMGYDDYKLSKGNGNITLVNPQENTVYLKYEVLYNDTVIYSTDGIKPSNIHNWNAYETLNSINGSGDYKVVFRILAYDMDTFTQLNSATQTLTVSIN